MSRENVVNTSLLSGYTDIVVTNYDSGVWQGSRRGRPTETQSLTAWCPGCPVPGWNASLRAVLGPESVVEGRMNGADTLDCPDSVCPPCQCAQGGRRLIMQGNNASVWRLVFQWYQVTPASDLAPLFANLAAIDPSSPRFETCSGSARCPCRRR